MTIIEGIDLIERIDQYDVILVGTNTYHVMGNGFQKKIRYNYPFVYNLNLTTKYADKNKMGQILCTETKPRFCLCFIVNGYNFRPDLTPDYLDYDALEKCIKKANIEFSGLNVATTLIGCSKYDGNGNRDKVLEIILNNSNDMNLFVYDYEQIDNRSEKLMKRMKINANKDCDKKTKLAMYKTLDSNTPMDNIEKRMKKIKEEVKSLLNK